MRVSYKTILHIGFVVLVLAALSPIMPGKLLLLLLLWFVLLRFAARRTNPINCVYWIWFPWLLSMLPVTLSVITYSDPEISAQAIGLIFIYLCITTLGYTVLAPKFDMQTMIENGIQVRLSIARHKKIIDLLAALGLLGSILFFLEMYAVVGVDLNNLFTLRSAFSNRQVTVLSQISPLIAWGGWVSLAAAVIGSGGISSTRKYTWMILGLSGALLSVLSAGRQTIFLIILVIVMAHAFRNSSDVRKTLRRSYERPPSLIMMSAIFAGIIYMALVAILRVDSANTTSKSEYLFSIFGVQPDWSTFGFLQESIGGATDAFYETLLYFSSGVSSFSAFITGDPLGPFWGKMTFPWVGRRLNFLSEYSPEQALALLAGYNEQVGAMPVGWSTAFGILIWDFGFLGSIALVFFMGLLAGQAWRVHISHANIFSLMLVFFANINFLYLLMMPATSDTVSFFFVCGNLLIVVGLRRRQTQGRRFKNDLSAIAGTSSQADK